MTGINFKIQIFIIGIIIAIIGIFIFFFYNATESKEIIIKKDNNKKSIWKMIKEFFKDKNLRQLFIYSFAINMIGYALLDGWIKKIAIDVYYANLDLNLSNLYANNLMNYANLTIMIFAISIGFLTKFIGKLKMLKISSILQLIGILSIILFYSKSIIFLNIGIIFISIGLISHIIPQYFIGEKYSGEETGIFFGIMNFGAMTLGCGMGQFLFGQLIEIIKIGPIYNYYDVLKVILYLGIPSTFMAIFMAFTIKENK